MLIPILVSIAIVILAGLAMVLVAQMQRKSRSRMIQVEIHNLGNVQSRYELQAKDPQGILKFRFTLDGDELPRSSGRSAKGLQVSAERPRQQIPAGQAPVPDQRESRSGGGIGDRALEGGGIIASMLSTLGLLLPRSMGASLTRTAGEMRRGQIAASRAKQLKSQSKSLKSKASPGRVGPAHPTTSGQATAESPGEAQAEWMEQAEWAEPPWAETPSVEPDGVLTVDLQVSSAPPPLLGSPSGGRAGGEYPFTVLSRTAELRELKGGGQAPVVTTEQSVQLPGTSRFLRLLPYLVILAITACLLALTFLLAG